MLRQIAFYSAKILRVKTANITKIESELREEMVDLAKMLGESENGAGLAATQIGVSKRFFGVRNHDLGGVDIFINPKIEAVYGEKVYPWIVKENGEKEEFLEGCLSFPDYFGTVKRFLKIDVSWEMEEGGKLMPRFKTMAGLEAIVFQHETDHLDGILFVDHVKRDGGKFYKWAGEERIGWDIDKVIRGEI